METKTKKQRTAKPRIRVVSVGQVIDRMAKDDRQFMAMIAEQVERNTEKTKERFR